MSTQVVRRYLLQLRLDAQDIEMPECAEILHVGEDSGAVAIWAQHDATPTSVTPRRFLIIKTGHAFEDGLATYIGTVQSRHGGVWHIYELHP